MLDIGDFRQIQLHLAGDRPYFFRNFIQFVRDFCAFDVSFKSIDHDAWA